MQNSEEHCIVIKKYDNPCYTFRMFNIVGIISATGYVGITSIVFAECGLFFGFFLPGDSLLFTAGFLASTGVLHIIPLVLLTLTAAITGETVGYVFGRKIGPLIWNKKQSRFFDPAHVGKAHEFFLHHGNKAVFLARFIPIIRTFVPVVAGVAKMPVRAFTLYNIIGGIAWAGGITLLGYGLGSSVPDAEKYLLPIIVVIIVVSFIPAVLEWRKAKRTP